MTYTRHKYPPYPNVQVEKIIEIIRNQSDNPAARYSYNGHAVFDDYNLGFPKALYDAAVDYVHWKEYIDRTYKDDCLNETDDWAGVNFIEILESVLAASNALISLSMFADTDLEAAEEYLHTHGMPK